MAISMTMSPMTKEYPPQDLDMETDELLGIVSQRRESDSWPILSIFARIVVFLVCVLLCSRVLIQMGTTQRHCGVSSSVSTSTDSAKPKGNLRNTSSDASKSNHSGNKHEHVKDIYESRDYNNQAQEALYIRYLTQGHKRNNTIILVQANMGFVEFALNLDCALRHLNLPPPIYWTMSIETNLFFRQAGLTTYFNPTYSGTSDSVDYHAKDYNSMMRQRPAVWRLFLEAGVNILWIDADVIVKGDVFAAIEWDADLSIQTDWRGLNISKGRSEFDVKMACAGLFHLQSTLGGKQIIDSMIDMLKIHTDLEDQQILNDYVIFEPKLTYVAGLRHNKSREDASSEAIDKARQDNKSIVRFVHPLDWTNGHLLRSGEVFRKGSNWFYNTGNVTHPSDRIPQVLHANSLLSKDKKIFMQKQDGWLLTDDLRCNLSL